MRRLGPHVTGLANAVCNLAVYPIFQCSIQLQLGRSPEGNYRGTSLRQRIYTFIYEPHTANRPYRPAVYHNYTGVLIGNSLQGRLGFYKGWSMAVSHFHLSILSRTLATSLLVRSVDEESLRNKQVRILIGQD